MTSHHIVLIRGIGGPSHALITMKELGAAVQGSGIGHVRSVLATGNFVVQSNMPAAEVERCFSMHMTARGLHRPIVMRVPEQLPHVLQAGSKLQAVTARPERVLVHFFQRPLNGDVLERVTSRTTCEQAFTLADELVVDFADGVSTSPLKLEFLERCAGSTGTGRNWNTVVKLLAAATAMGWSGESPEGTVT
jgi:uncharacterized protein (DUF1697 family)